MNRRTTLAAAVAIVFVLILICAWGWYWFGYGGKAASMARSGDPQQRLLAIQALSAKGSSLARRTLEGLADDENLQVATHAVRALGARHASDRREALQRILRASPHAQLRGEAAAALGGFGDPADLDALLGALRDKDARVRAGAARGLARLENRAALPGLVDALEDDAAEVRYVAIWAIKEIIGVRLLFEPDAAEPARQQQVQAIRKWMKDKGLT